MGVIAQLKLFARLADSMGMKALIVLILGLSLGGCATGLFKKSEPPSDAEEYPISTFMMDHENMKVFIEENCAKQPMSDKEFLECDAAYRKAFIARLSNRYPRTDWAKVKNWCDIHPKPCMNSYQDIEIEAQNNQLREPSSSSSSTGFWAAFGAALGADMAVRRQSAISCVTNKVGQTAYTNCR